MRYSDGSKTFREKRAEQVGGGVFLIGLALLFIAEFPFWPGILFVIGASALASGVAEGRVWGALNGGLWLIGLAVLFITGLWWPGILILLGASMLLGGAGMRERHRRFRHRQDMDDVVIIEKAKNDEKRKNEDLTLEDRERFYIVDDDDDYAQTRR